MAGRFRSRVGGVFFALSLLAADPARADDLDTLYARYHARFLDAIRASSDAQTQGFINTLSANGTWPDIDLTLREQVNWTPLGQLNRLGQMAKVYVTTGSTLSGSPALGAAISKAIDAYIRQDPVSTNWWYNEIGAQLSLGPLMYLMGSHLTADQAKGFDAIMARSWKSAQRTGENLVWISRATIWRGVFDHDPAAVKAAVEAIATTLAITTGEGIQRDFSFYQHGPQLYSGGYGNAFTSDAASLADDLRATQYEFPPAQLGLISDFLLQGQRWMVHGGVMDHSVRGREITRAGGGSASGWANAATIMAAIIPAAAPDLNAMAAAIKTESGSSVEGDRWFWRSEYLAHHRHSYFISVRMASSRLNASELVNNEGLLSRYLSDGATLFYRSGREYDAIFPVWDWCRIPGVTVAHTAAPPAIPAPNPGTGTFAGGVSDGNYGAAAFDYGKLGVKARKSWFFFDREMVALGAGISSTAAGSVQTTLNQCLLNGPVQVATGSAAAPAIADFAPGSTLASPPLWVLHDGIGYLLGSPQDKAVPALTAGSVSGNWRRINASQSDSVVNENVFSLWLDHGVQPADGHYQYTTLMDATAAELTAYANAPYISVLSNTADLQAVRHTGKSATLATFYGPGSLQIDGRITLSPSRACMLLVQEYPDRMVLSVSDPVHGTADLIVKADAKLDGPGAVWSAADNSTTVTFVLPKGDSAGATVSRGFAALGVAVRPEAKAPGLAVSARLAGAGGQSLIVTYTVPGPGEARLTLLDAEGRASAGFAPGRVAAGTHAWNAPVPTRIGSAGGWVRLQWEGRQAVVPLAAAGH